MCAACVWQMLNKKRAEMRSWTNSKAEWVGKIIVNELKVDISDSEIERRTKKKSQFEPKAKCTHAYHQKCTQVIVNNNKMNLFVFFCRFLSSTSYPSKITFSKVTEKKTKRNEDMNCSWWYSTSGLNSCLCIWLSHFPRISSVCGSKAMRIGTKNIPKLYRTMIAQSR